MGDRVSCLTQADMDRIHELASPRRNGTRLSPAAIAKLIERPSNAVAWYMYCAGLKVRRRAKPAQIYRRKNGTLVRAYGEAEDTYVVQLRSDGFTYREIAGKVQERFGHERTPHSISVRLTMLASFESAAEDGDRSAPAPRELAHA